MYYEVESCFMDFVVAIVVVEVVEVVAVVVNVIVNVVVIRMDSFENSYYYYSISYLRTTNYFAASFTTLS